MTNQTFVSTVYGPVHSWREGKSLGIDLILSTSVCSFNCIYCQLGAIQNITTERQIFIQTEQVIRDFKASHWRESDILTFSGSGEPTLAINLGDVSRALAEIAPQPQLVLTNGTLLNNEDVIQDLQSVDRVYVKLDAGNEATFQRINRPADGLSLQQVIQNTLTFQQSYPGYLGLQIMIMPSNQSEIDEISRTVEQIQPDEVQLNTPTRPYAKVWNVASRGGHQAKDRPYHSVPLKTISLESAEAFAKTLRERTGVRVRPVRASA
ncbi:MAG: radical SAM protein [Candidatus Hinthialibacter antarcticus]|nr:radical SAM protein [Candidatus Hinthialibacter antarcticus]